MDYTEIARMFATGVSVGFAGAILIGLASWAITLAVRTLTKVVKGR